MPLTGRGKTGGGERTNDLALQRVMCRAVAAQTLRGESLASVPTVEQHGCVCVSSRKMLLAKPTNHLGIPQVRNLLLCCD